MRISEKEYNEIKSGKKSNRSITSLNRIKRSKDWQDFKQILIEDRTSKKTKKRWQFWK
jgi:hypothetical protein